jgi:peroxiredoxin
LRSLQGRLAEFEARGVRLAAISVDPPGITREHRRRQGYTFTFLSDPEAEVIRRYGLLHEGGRADGADISRPAGFLLDAGGTIRWRSLTDSYAVRATPGEILEAVEAADLGVAR